MDDQPTNDPDVDLDCEDLRDRHGNRVTREYVERALADIVNENVLVVPSEVRPDGKARPSRPSPARRWSSTCGGDDPVVGASTTHLTGRG